MELRRHLGKQEQLGEVPRWGAKGQEQSVSGKGREWSDELLGAPERFSVPVLVAVASLYQDRGTRTACTFSSNPRDNILIRDAVKHRTEGFCILYYCNCPTLLFSLAAPGFSWISDCTLPLVVQMYDITTTIA